MEFIVNNLAIASLKQHLPKYALLFAHFTLSIIDKLSSKAKMLSQFHKSAVPHYSFNISKLIKRKVDILQGSQALSTGNR